MRHIFLFFFFVKAISSFYFLLVLSDHCSGEKAKFRSLERVSKTVYKIVLKCLRTVVED